MNGFAALSMLALLAAAPAADQQAQERSVQARAPQWDPAARLAAQREAMKALAFLDGTWRGEAEFAGMPPVVQTERIGPMLDGTVRVMEGRGYGADDRTAFNAFAVLSYDPARRSYSMRTYAMGRAGDYPLDVRPNGFSWSHPAGRGATMRYTATVSDGVWHQIGERIAEDAAPVKVFEMGLTRLGDSGWPAAGAVPPR